MPGLFQRLKYLLTGKLPAGDAALGRMQARIDAARTTDENKKHWASADNFSADAAYDPSVRFRLRNRSRYEAINNCYAKSSVRSAADDLIGTGPRLQVQIPDDPEGKAAKIVEWNYCAWATETRQAIKLRTAEKSRVRDGECFCIFDENERLRNPVKFDTRWVEPEMCTTPFDMAADPQLIDGVRFDRLGNPTDYYFLKAHPGSTTLTGLVPLQFYSVAAEHVCHWFNLERFGQHRAIPELTPSLPLYSQMRRYSLAVLTSAEFAAMLSGVMKTNLAPDDGNAVKVDQWELFELVRGALLTLPNGWEATQFETKNPPAAYSEFKREVLNECGRATNQPLNVVTGNSSGYNYSSGRLDHVPYQRGIRIQRNDLRLLVLDPIFHAWYQEALLVGQIPDGIAPIEQWRWTWNFDGFDSIDANKDAAADDVRIKNGTSTYAEILAEYGQSWEEVFEQLAREKAYAQRLGLPWPVLAAPASAGNAAQGPAPSSLEQTVQYAMDDAGIDEDVAGQVLEALRPTFAAMRASTAKPSRNGYRPIGISA